MKIEGSIISRIKYLEMKSLIYGGTPTGYLMMNGMNTIRALMMRMTMAG